MHPALFYFPGDKLSLAELCSARLDGHVVEIDEAYMPADTVEGPSARATAIAPLVPEGTAAIGPSAAWVHGAGDTPPTLHHIQRAEERRRRIVTGLRTEYHDVPLSPGRAIRIGPTLVTDPLHTMVDLARMCHRHPGFARWARALALIAPDLAPLAHDELRRRPRVPGKLRGLELLRELSDDARTR